VSTLGYELPADLADFVRKRKAGRGE
jgi:hypothetical protein